MILTRTSTRTRLAVAACLLSLGATGLAAQDHTILIMPDAYFPDITHVDIGETILFVNTTSETQNIVAVDEAWSVGPIAPQGEVMFDVLEGHDTEYFNANSFDADTAVYSVTGFLTFDEAPLN